MEAQPVNELQQAQLRLAEALESQRRIMERFRRHQARELMHFQPLDSSGKWGKLTFYDRETLRRTNTLMVFWDNAKRRSIEPRHSVIPGSHSPSPVGAEYAVQLAERELALQELRAGKAALR
jgi:hypothetical protein